MKGEVKVTGLETTSMSTAVADGLSSFGARRIAVATAYNDAVNRRLRAFLGESGFEVLALRGLGLEIIGDAGKVSQAELQKFSADVFTSATKADALLVSCGELRTLELLAPLENDCRVPVVSSTPHALLGRHATGRDCTSKRPVTEDCSPADDSGGGAKVGDGRVRKDPPYMRATSSDLLPTHP
jgi:maleate cis-trans isomerase